MKVKKMLLREETAKVLHTKSNGDKLVAAASGDGYTAFTKDDVHIGHISAETDPAAIAEFSKKEPKYEALDMSLEELQRTADRYLDVEIDELMRTILEKTSSMNREQLSRLVRWCRNFYTLLEEFVSADLTEGYMDTHEGVAHIDTLDLMAALKSVVREYGHMELVTPLYCELHDDEHGRRLELNRAVDEQLLDEKTFKAVRSKSATDKPPAGTTLSRPETEAEVAKYVAQQSPSQQKKIATKLAAAIPAEDIQQATDKLKSKLDDKVLTDYDKQVLKEKTNIDPKIIEGADTLFELIDGLLNLLGDLAPVVGIILDVLELLPIDEIISGVPTGGCGAIVTGILSALPQWYLVGLAVQWGITGVKALGKNIKDMGINLLAEDNDDFMDAENMDMSEFDSHVGKEEDIEFVMTEYIADSTLIEFVKKVDATTWLVGVEDEVVTVKFDPSWSEYVYTIEGKGPYSHRSYEYISRDVYDFVMSQRASDKYDDDFDDLSSFNECSEVKRADALYGVGERNELVEAVYTDTNGIMGIVGETYTTAELRKIWNDSHNDDPSMAKYNGDYDGWVSDTLAQMSRNDGVDEAFDMSYGPDLGKLSWQVSSFLDVDALGEDKWIEFICDDPRDVVGSTKTMRFEAIGENDHKYGFIRTNGDAVDVQFRNGSEAMCHSAEEVARFIAGEFGISL